MRPVASSLVALALLGATPALHAADYFVAPDGDDAGAGTEAAPFLTIGHAAGVMAAGDVCWVREGVYRETVTPANSGAAASPIVFQAYPGERPLVAGTDLLDVQWELHTGSVYKTTVAGSVEYLFADGQMMNEARWPNAEVENLVEMPRARTEAGTGTTMLVDSNIPSGDWTGALLHIVSGEEWVSYTRPVESFDDTTKTLSWTVPIDDIEKLYPAIGDPYYLFGSLLALDAPGEWHFDPTTNELYFWAPGGGDPNQMRVGVKVRDIAFDLSARSYIEVRGFSVLAANIQMDGSQFVTVDDCHLRHPANLREFDGYGSPDPTSRVTGNDNVWRSSTVEHSATSGLIVGGTNNLVTDCLFSDVAYGAANSAGILSGGSNPGTANNFSNNTITRSGRFGLSHYETTSSRISYNEISHGCLLTLDCGLTYAWETDGQGTEISYNHLFENLHHWSNGIYLDDGSANHVVHHNLVYRVEKAGILIKAPNDIYNNTLIEAPESVGFRGIGVEPHVETQVDPDLSLNTFANNLVNSTVPLRMRFAQATVTDFGFYEASRAVESNWQTFVIPFADLAQPGWANPVTFTAAALDQVLFDVSVDGDYELWIDNVRWATSGILIDDFEDNDATDPAGGSWVAAADAASTASLSLAGPGNGSSYAATLSCALAQGGWCQIQDVFVSSYDASPETGVRFDARVVYALSWGSGSQAPVQLTNDSCTVDGSYFPVDACAIDAGTAVAGITDGYQGAAPDIGAFESGTTPWLAGAGVVPDFYYPDQESDPAPSPSGGAGGAGAGAGVGPSTAGAAGAGAVTGGSSTAGVAGAETSTGGTSSGGIATSGASTGGAATGGTVTGGTSAGGTPAGGTSTGGTPAGGTSAGGTSAGGTSAGGTSDADGGASPPASADSGCGCHLAQPSGASWWLAALALGAFATRRRRRTTA